jgi:YVTN family beta-propeller protein
MLPQPHHPKTLRALLRLTAVFSLAALALWLVYPRATRTAHAQSTPAQFKNFEGPQVHPLAMTPDGTRLLAVNTPNATLSVFQLVSGAPVLTAEIPVGMEPVSVAVRSNGREAWVANWLSDSVSVVDLATGNVTRTMDVGDEPTDVLFAGSAREMAFVCVSGGGQQSTASGTITGGIGVVKVFDPSNPAAIPQTINIFGKQPRALARDAAGARVFVSVFESGNQTTVVSQADVAAGGGLPPPNPPLAAGLPAPPNTGLIVKWNGSAWADELGRSWNSVIPYRLPDDDIVFIDASGATPVLNNQAQGVGTHNGNMVFDSATNRLFVANLEDINQVRFEPNVRGRFQASRVSVVSAQPSATPTVASVSDLNAHVDFNNPAGSDSERALSLAMPADLVRQSDGTLYVAATGSARVGVLDSAGAVQGRIAVGQGPTGLALDEARSRLYVLNRFDETISVVDTLSKTQVSQVSVGFNPEPASVRDGRHFLYDASLSAHGTVSCESCHLNGHRDGMVWDLGDPQGQVASVSVFLPAGTKTPSVSGSEDLHPMKGPTMTQSLRGIIGNEPLHWRGDRAGLENFNPAFVSLLGGTRQLTADEFASFKAFVQSLTYPPNPNEALTRQSAETTSGFSFFSTELLDGNSINCSQCHLVTHFGVGTDNKITPSLALQEPQAVKVPQLRGLYQKLGLNRGAGQLDVTGFGFAHDGTFDSLFNFMKAPQFDFRTAGDNATADSWRRDMEQMILRLDTGTPPAVGLMVTVDASNKTAFNVTNRISLLASQAAAGNCDLVVRGIYGGSPRGFLRLQDGTFQPDTLSEAPVSLQTLLAAAGTGAELTFLGVPAGEGRLFALDRDGNGILNDDEPHTSVSLTGRVVDANGAGIAGVAVALSGTQSSTAVTDASGRFTFNFLSMSGTHTVTPQSASLQFTPASRTFAAPSWNQTADFVSAATANASDASQFFVAQHYNDFLARDPDAAGLQFWTNDIEGCSTSVCRDIRRVDVSAAFFLSIEFQETGYLVYRAYKASFGDLPGKPVPVTFQQLMTDTQRVGRNVIVNVGNWQQQLETNKVAFFQGWVQRPAFVAAYGGLSAADFVDKLNANAGGSLNASERDALVTQLAANNTTAGRAAAVRSVAENAAFKQRESNKAFVLMQYFGYLRRNPDDAPEATLDFQGYNFWLSKLNQFNGNFVQAEMVKAFITSIEYRQRFGQ